MASLRSDGAKLDGEFHLLVIAGTKAERSPWPGTKKTINKLQNVLGNKLKTRADLNVKNTRYTPINSNAIYGNSTYTQCVRCCYRLCGSRFRRLLNAIYCI